MCKIGASFNDLLEECAFLSIDSYFAIVKMQLQSRSIIFIYATFLECDFYKHDILSFISLIKQSRIATCALLLKSRVILLAKTTDSYALL